MIALRKPYVDPAVDMVRLSVERGWIARVAAEAARDGIQSPVVVLVTPPGWRHLGMDAVDTLRELPFSVGQCQRSNGCPRFRVVAVPEAELPPAVARVAGAGPCVDGWHKVVSFAHGGHFSATVRRTGTDANTSRCTT